jgi:PAS domain S-box-containing protein
MMNSVSALSTATLEEVAENSDQMIWLRDPQSRQFFYISPAYEKIWGRSVQSLYEDPLSWREAIHPEDKEKVLTVVGKQENHNVTYRIIRPDGTIRWVTARVFSIRDSTGEVIRMAGIVADVTEQRQVESALHESEERLRQIAENANQVIWLQEVGKPIVLYINPAYEKISGRSLASVYAAPDSWHELIHPEDRERVIQEFSSTPTGEPLVFRIVRDDGVMKWISLQGFPIRDSSGKPIRVAGIATDVTDQLETEKALRESERRFRELAENIEQVFWLWNPSGVVYVSKAYETLWGRSCDELYRKPYSWRDSIHPEDRKRVVSEVRGMPTKRLDLEYRIIRPDGELRWIRDRVFPLADEDGRITRFAGVTDDITKYKAAEAALRESEVRFRQLAENIEEVFWTWTREPVQLLYVSPAYERIWGRDRESLYKDPLSWRQAVHPEDREHVIQAVTGPPEARVDMSYRIIRPDGEVRWMRERIFPIAGKNGSVVRWIAVTDDITENKQAEEALKLANRRLQVLSRRRIQVQEEERKRLAVELHDQLGQTLTAIQLSLEATKRNNRGPKRADQLKQATDLINQMMQEVRRMSLGLRPPVLDDLGLVAALRSLLTESAKQSGWTVEFREPKKFSLPDDEVATACFRIVSEALTNIIRHANAKNVSMEIATADEQFAVKISDDGVGFDMTESEKRIQRDHLGLVGMNERASAVGGTFRCRSGTASGTEITIVLPFHAT